jgi:hypothetical protein
MNAISRMSPPQVGHASGNSSPTRAISFAHAIREVSCERGFNARALGDPHAVFILRECDEELHGDKAPERVHTWLRHRHHARRRIDIGNDRTLR